MKFEPKTVDADVNLPKRHPLADMAWMLGGLAVICAVVFISGGFLVDQIARFIPAEYDNKISGHLPEELFSEFGPAIEDGELLEDTQALFERLRPLLPEDDVRNYTLTVIDTDDVNALAMPGGHIVVLRGLLEAAESENEVAMVLAHEYGHIYHKHHWRRLGRAFLFGVVAAAFGSQSSTQLANIPLTTMLQANSRSHENESDRFALGIVCKLYGHSGGATDFFERNIDTQPGASKAVNFLSTHPLSEERVQSITKLASKSNCPEGATIYWPHLQL